MIFTSPRMINCVHEHDTVASDPTFRVTPRLLGSLQVMILAFFAFGSTYTIGMAIMKAKTRRSYAAVFNKFREMGLVCEAVITDWEQTERDGWRDAYPGIKVLGCVWHYIRVSTA
ncbi:uncharacterized protein LOC127751523 [Frankliniella occidentalis]|uniref:Uncharacterized protein LOC127751523 n=1 Tax=Frankliniella occidentalis TaxID=133901 RepID=A0A9C6XU69_FRAOC|nr:uncharacterized protein LOC127751523 [Frankliniella occidentalis]